MAIELLMLKDEFLKLIAYFIIIQKLKKLVNLNDNFKSLGINIQREKIKILSGVNEQRLANNPVKLNVNEIIKIIS